MRVSPTQLSVLRMIPIARQIARRGHGRVAVFRLLNAVRGWDASHTPVDDVDWALRQLPDVHGLHVPVGLVGHSLGARAAVLAAPAPQVRTVVALSAFVYPQDGTVDAHGARVLFVHGTADRIAPIDRARSAAHALARTADVEFRVVEGGKHAMLRHHRDFDDAAAKFVTSTD